MSTLNCLDFWSGWTDLTKDGNTFRGGEVDGGDERAVFVAARTKRLGIIYLHNPYTDRKTLQDGNAVPLHAVDQHGFWYTRCRVPRTKKGRGEDATFYLAKR
jgi:hypothetical protein